MWSHAEVKAARDWFGLQDRHGVAKVSAAIFPGQEVKARGVWDGKIRADETSFRFPEVTCVFIFCFVTSRLFWRREIPIDEGTENVRKSATRRFFAIAAESVLRGSNGPANAYSGET